MKKIKGLLLMLILAVVLCGCGNKVTSSTCSGEESGVKMNVEMKAVNDEIDEVEMIITPDNTAMGITSFKDVDDATKEQIKELMLSSLGLADEEPEGIDVDVQFNDEMIIKLDIDFKEADKSFLANLGLDLDEADMSLSRAVSDLESSGYTCD